jgi:hypothetical protein
MTPEKKAPDSEANSEQPGVQVGYRLATLPLTSDIGSGLYFR